MEQFECCICKDVVSSQQSTSVLDPCALILVSNTDEVRDNQKEQQFYCHFECFRRLVKNDSIMYVMESDQPKIGEIKEDEKNWSEDDDLLPE